MSGFSSLKYKSASIAHIPRKTVCETSDDSADKSESKYRKILRWSVQCTGCFFLLCLFGIAVIYCYRTGQEIWKDDAPSASAPTQCSLSDNDRFDCYPEGGATEETCSQRGCCWKKQTTSRGAPSCFFPPNYDGYTVTDVQETTAGIIATLTRTTSTFFSPDVKTLKLVVEYQTPSRLRIKLFDPQNARFEVPLDVPSGSAEFPDHLYNVTIEKGPFNIVVRRKSTGVIVFDTRSTAPLIFSDQYIQISTRLSTKFLYGFGEHRNHFLQDLSTWRRLVFWNTDDVPKIDNNGYGSHNYFLNLESDVGTGDAHGVFLLNSNAGEVALQPFGSSSTGAVTYRTLGGILDFFIVLGPKPLSVVSQFAQITGPPYFPPFWSLGYHICKYGIANETELRAMINRNRKANIPYDTQWSDIDYMDSLKDWTVDKLRYGNLPHIVEDLHDNQQRYIMIVDPGISSNQTSGTYTPYDDGIVLDVFVKDANGEILIGRVWPGETAFPDFFHPKALQYLYKQASHFHTQIPFDGLWLDMNEPSNFVTGSVLGCTHSTLDNPPYIPPSIDGGSLIARTFCPSAKHAISTHYDLHNMYGWSETNVTRAVLDKIFPNKRSPIISRSTFAGSGRDTGHWLGDNNSSFSDMFYSIPAVLNFNIFGIPFIGADICGFRGAPTPELCVRWHQIAVFYPFMRNHASHTSPYQDPASFSQPYQDFIRKAIELRYRLLAVLYTAFFKAHTEGLPIVRPLFYQYAGTEAIDRQFMWSDQLLVYPVLEEGATSVSVYIPQDVLYDFYNGSQILQTGRSVTLQAPLGHIHIHVRGGSILPLFPVTQRTDMARKERFQVVVAPDAEGNAEGELFWDDGESADSVRAEHYSLVAFASRYSDKIFTSHAKVAGYLTPNELKLGEVVLLGVPRSPSQVLVNGESNSFVYSPDVKVLYVTLLDMNLLEAITIQWN